MNRSISRAVGGALVLALLGVKSALAMEPRPWLCREIPVFSNDKPMTWTAKRAGAGQWVLTFMHYDAQGGGHDGFTVVATEPVSSAGVSGTLAAGRYYAVALHRAGEHWICPENASPTGASAGYVTRLCYGEDADSCDVRMTVQAGGSDTPN